jgi:DNA-directed RNA polymerase specialized sigma24 family protein
VLDAEDVVQENATRSLAWTRSLRGAGVAALLLYRIATNRSLNAIGERARPNHGEHRETVKNLSPSSPAGSSPTGQRTSGSRSRTRTRSTLRAALVLRDVLGFHTDEAA